MFRRKTPETQEKTSKKSLLSRLFGRKNKPELVQQVDQPVNQQAKPTPKSQDGEYLLKFFKQYPDLELIKGYTGEKSLNDWTSLHDYIFLYKAFLKLKQIAPQKNQRHKCIATNLPLEIEGLCNAFNVQVGRRYHWSLEVKPQLDENGNNRTHYFLTLWLNTTDNIVFYFFPGWQQNDCEFDIHFKNADSFFGTYYEVVPDGKPVKKQKGVELDSLNFTFLTERTGFTQSSVHDFMQELRQKLTMDQKISILRTVVEDLRVFSDID